MGAVGPADTSKTPAQSHTHSNSQAQVVNNNILNEKIVYKDKIVEKIVEKIVYVEKTSKEGQKEEKEDSSKTSKFVNNKVMSKEDIWKWNRWFPTQKLEDDMTALFDR